MEQQISLNLLNKAAYGRDDVVKFYCEADSLMVAEKVIFDKLSSKIRDSKILDIGIGGGRTTKHLLQMTGDYTGVDYVEKFAHEAAEKYPVANILCRDATNLTDFNAETYDFVLFSYNGIDSISNDQRLLVLNEAYRVLKKGGIFMFSSHNRDYRYFNKFPWQQKFHFTTRHLIFLLHCLYHLPNHYRMKKHEVYTDDYAIINDGDHRYSLLLYYINIKKQKKQLKDLGFTHIDAYDINGQPVENDVSSHWIQYVVRKD